MVCPLNARGALRAQYKTLSRDLVATKDAEGLVALIEQRTDMHYEDFDYCENEAGEDTAGEDNGAGR